MNKIPFPIAQHKSGQGSKYLHVRPSPSIDVDMPQPPYTCKTTVHWLYHTRGIISLFMDTEGETKISQQNLWLFSSGWELKRRCLKEAYENLMYSWWMLILLIKEIALRRFV